MQTAQVWTTRVKSERNGELLLKGEKYLVLKEMSSVGLMYNTGIVTVLSSNVYYTGNFLRDSICISVSRRFDMV